MHDKEELIRQRAYAIWEAEGFPEGCEELHWQQAREEISAASAGDEANAGATETGGAMQKDRSRSGKSPKRVLPGA